MNMCPFIKLPKKAEEPRGQHLQQTLAECDKGYCC